MDRKAIICLFAALCQLAGLNASGPEVIVQVNTKKWMYYLPQRFLSLTVDPLTLAAAGPLTQASFNMAKGLSPGFVRIGGIGTSAIHFGKQIGVNETTVSESQWDSVNEFSKHSGLDIIAALNPENTEGVWDSDNSQQLIYYSNKRRYNVIWQLGYDTVSYNASGAATGKSLLKLTQILSKFPKYANSPVFGPDVLSVSGAKQIHFIKDLLANAGSSLGSLVLQPNFQLDSDSEDPEELITSMINELDLYVWNKEVRTGRSLPKRPVWIAEPKASKGTFQDAMELARRLGFAARSGVQIYLRQVGANSLKAPTPEFWFSMLYKTLVGQGVLDAKVISSNASSITMFSHCTPSIPQDKSILDTDWSYDKGAVTLFGINQSPDSVKLGLKLTNKEEPLHMYVLTSEENDSLQSNSIPTTLLNGQELTLSPTKELPVLSPRVKRPSRSSLVQVPGGSIFFIVAPDSKIRTCSVPPLSTPDINLSDLTRRLRLGPQKSEDPTEDDIDPEEQPDEHIYVSFNRKKKNIQPENNPPESLGKNLVKNLLSKLSSRIQEARTEAPAAGEKVTLKYVSLDRHGMLRKLADDMKRKKEEKVEEQLESAKSSPEAASAISEVPPNSSPDVVLIDPVLDTKQDVPDSGKELSRKRRSSNEDPPVNAEVLDDSTSDKTKPLPVSEILGNVGKTLDPMEVLVKPEKGKESDTTRNARHIDTNSPESEEERTESETKAKTTEEAEENEQQKTDELAKVVEETEKMDRVSEMQGNVMFPAGVSDKKMGEILLEAAKEASELKPDSGDASSSNPSTTEPPAQAERTSENGESNITPQPEMPSRPSATPPKMFATPVLIQPIILSAVPVNHQGIAYEAQPPPMSSNQFSVPPQEMSSNQFNASPQEMIANPQFDLTQEMRPNHVQKISQMRPPVSLNNEDNSVPVFVAPEEPVPTIQQPVYNEQKERVIDKILTDIAAEENAEGPHGHVNPQAQQSGDLVAVQIPGNNTLLLERHDLETVVHKNVKSGDETLGRDSQPINLEEFSDKESSIKVSRQVGLRGLGISPRTPTATLAAPIAIPLTTTPAGPVSPFKATLKEPSRTPGSPTREPPKSPEELRERFKVLRDKMVELRNQYVATRDKRLEEFKKQVATARANPTAQTEDGIKSTIKRRETELKDWFKRFDKRETEPTTVVVSEVPSGSFKSRPRRLSLFSNDEGIDLDSIFEGEPEETLPVKRSPEIDGQNTKNNVQLLSSPKLKDDLDSHIFPLDSKIHGIVYNNRIYPAKLFGYLDRGDLLNKNQVVEEKTEATTLNGEADDPEDPTGQKGRLAFIPKDVFVKETKSDFIPVVIIPPHHSKDEGSESRPKRSTLSNLEEHFHHVKEEVFPTLKSWIERWTENPPWKRDLHRFGGRAKRSIDDILRTNDLRSFQRRLISPRFKSPEEVEDSVLNKIDATEDELYRNAEEYLNVLDDLGNKVVSKDDPTSTPDIGFCEEVGDGVKSLLKDNFAGGKLTDSTQLEAAGPLSEEGEVRLSESSEGTSLVESIFTSFLADKIKSLLETLKNLIGNTSSDM